MVDWLFDGLLAVALLWLGWRTIAAAHLFEAIVLFIMLGLLMALAWARLAAPDLALAEAALGAGLTGALLLDAYRVLARYPLPSPAAGVPVPLALGLGLLSGGLIVALGWAASHLPLSPAAVSAAVYTRLPDSGVGNPVTAVLLNFRGYDTLLEVAVLLLAWLGMWTVQQHPDALDSPPSPDSRLVDGLVQLLVPLALIFAVYLLWAGVQSPGGAFQAGAVLAAVGVLLQLNGQLQPAATASLGVRAGLIAGLAVFIAVGWGVMATGSALLQYPPALAGGLILVIETAIMVSTALTLMLLFGAAAGLRRSRG